MATHATDQQGETVFNVERATVLGSCLLCNQQPRVHTGTIGSSSTILVAQDVRAAP